MSEDIRPDVIKKTQDSLGKFIKKPTLTEKLLRKPPFRFLHDICTSVARETGFFETVLNQEDQQFENIKDKEGKILFLQKVIAAVESAGGVKLGVKPNKVVAGLEATKTNEFLQALGKVLEKQQLQKRSSKTAVSIKSKSIKKEGKEVKEEAPDKKKSSVRVSKKIAESVQNENGDNKYKTDVTLAELTEEKFPAKKEEQTPSKEEELNSREGSPRNKYVKNGCAEEMDREIHRRSNVIGAGESKDVPDSSILRINGSDGQGDKNHGAKEQISRNGEPREVRTGKQKNRRPSLHVIPDRVKETEENLHETKGVNEIAATISLRNDPEFQDETAPNTLSGLNHFKKDINHVRENTLISRPRTGIRPTTARPASARPAAPRIRDRGDVVAVSEEVMKPASGKVHVIVDEEAVDETDEEALVSLERTNDADLEESRMVLSTENHTRDSERGHLVEQILEIQRELEDDSKFSQQKVTSKTEIEWEFGRNRESTNREIEKLRINIQTLTRTANPLGKLLDFFQEDFEIVQKELESWRDKNASYRLKIEQEKIVTEQYVEPLKIYLKEVQKNIDEQIDQISLVKANIIRNNEKITKLFSEM